MSNAKLNNQIKIPINQFATAEDVKAWIHSEALALGFADCGFVSVHNPVFGEQLQRLQKWLAEEQYGQMQFLENNHDKRGNPALLVEGAQTIVSVRMDYLEQIPTPRQIEDNLRPNHAIIARYARGRDYHKTMRGRLKKLAKRIEQMLPEWQHLGIDADKDFVFRPFSDSAPIFERPLAEQAGLGWTGKHTLLLNKKAGSFFVLGELFLSLQLPEDSPVSPHCGSCSACIDVCPTQAIIAPYEMNAEACISYLTIEHDGIIDEKYRRAIGNRIFGCDDCQLICPWNRYANVAVIDDFKPRHGLDNSRLIDLWQWSEAEFLERTQGNPLRRTGYISFLRNIAIGLGNITPQSNAKLAYKPSNANLLSSNNLEEQLSAQQVIEALHSRLGQHSDVLDDHIVWAINEQKKYRY